jgi:phosphoribosylamine--glycine ligase
MPPEPAAPSSVMVIGGGSAREHALVRALRRSPGVSRVLYVPGNSAVEHMEGVESAPVASQDIPGLVELAEMEEIGLTVVGPNTPLIMGIVDRFREVGLPIFGPHQTAARLEGSKVFSKNFMMRCDIPTARFAVFEDTERAAYFCRRTPWARVIKTDKLAYEKGVEVCHSVAQCEEAIQRIMVDEVLDADQQARVVIEERLVGPEITLCVLSDGKDVLILDACTNYPRLGDGDTGPRTRGMGAVCPAPMVDDDLLSEMGSEIVLPAIRGLSDWGEPLIGALFVDLILENGKPYVLDFNVRFGDPATQVLVARLQSDLYNLLTACVGGTLGEFKQEMEMDPRTAVSVVLAAQGYPFQRRRDDPVTVSEDVAQDDWRFLDLGGMRHSKGELLSTGGRVATVTALGDDLETATRRAYAGVEGIRFDGVHFRSDIGSGR